jgi:branched-chain amino acid transport system substrate-binding protein
MSMLRCILACAAALAIGSASAQPADKVRIGFITDMSGLFADAEGPNGAVAIQMAIDDFGGKLLGRPVELLTADHQNKGDIAASKAREWFDTQNISLLYGGANSGIALALAGIANEKKRVYINSSAATSALTNERCTPYTLHYAYDTVALARGTGAAVVAQGGTSWYFLTADYAFGHALEADTAAVVRAACGQVLGSVRHPLNAPDFSSFLLQAKNSNAKILGLANASGDTVAALKAARDFGINRSMRMAGLLLFLSDIHSLGLRTAEGLLLTTSWYWDLNADTRAFAARFFEKTRRMPTELHAANYSATMAWLRAVAAVGTLEADAVMAQLKRQPLNDFFAKGYIRADGRYIHDMYLVQVKSPSESTRPWDYYKVLATLPGEKVLTTRTESKCPLLK